MKCFNIEHSSGLGLCQNFEWLGLGMRRISSAFQLMPEELVTQRSTAKLVVSKVLLRHSESSWLPIPGNTFRHMCLWNSSGLRYQRSYETSDETRGWLESNGLILVPRSLYYNLSHKKVNV